jgi:hypothetical protein
MLPAFSDREAQANLEIESGLDPAQSDSGQGQKGGNNL